MPLACSYPRMAPIYVAPNGRTHDATTRWGLLTPMNHSLQWSFISTAREVRLLQEDALLCDGAGRFDAVLLCKVHLCNSDQQGTAASKS
jgi:hypothetical protein